MIHPYLWHCIYEQKTAKNLLILSHMGLWTKVLHFHSECIEEHHVREILKTIFLSCTKMFLSLFYVLQKPRYVVFFRGSWRVKLGLSRVRVPEPQKSGIGHTRQDRRDPPGDS